MCFAFQNATPVPQSREAFTLYNSGTSEYTTKNSSEDPLYKLPRWRSPSTVNCHSLRWYPVLTMAWWSLQSIANFLYRWFSSQACSQPLICITSETSAPKVGPLCAWLEHRTGLQSLVQQAANCSFQFWLAGCTSDLEQWWWWRKVVSYSMGIFF